MLIAVWREYFQPIKKHFFPAIVPPYLVPTARKNKAFSDKKNPTAPLFSLLCAIALFFLLDCAKIDLAGNRFFVIKFHIWGANTAQYCTPEGINDEFLT